MEEGNYMRKYLQSGLIVLLLTFMIPILSSCGKKEDYSKLKKELEVKYDGNAKVSVGSAYVGVEMHHSTFLPQRISFYYPVANSIDLSTDYWKRDTTFIMAAGLKIGNGKKEWLGTEPCTFTSTPYCVTYQKSDEQKSVEVTYEFCKDKPAMVITYEITNTGKEKEQFEFYTQLQLSLKTCHTYALEDSAVTSFDKTGDAVLASFNDEGTQHAMVFAANAGEKPVSFNTIGSLNSSRTPNNEWWYKHDGPLKDQVMSKMNPGIPAAKFQYKKSLAPNEKMKVVQIIGSCRQNEGREMVEYLTKHYKDEVKKYNEYVLNKTFKDGTLETGDKVVDQTVNWAKAVLAANQHYINGEIVPMPCPAEYNFFFTHDVLLTDLAAVNFDLPRVKRDLKFIVEHASKDKVIPHAYYWMDSAYVTEFANSDNWNNYWFIIASASYLKHSGDKQLVESIYPYLTKSLENAMLTKKPDDVMWSYRPDWWDIGNNFGPRVYMTILAAKALRDYNFISTVIGKNTEKLADYDKLSDSMVKQVTSKFWSDKYKYLINYLHDGSIDPHYYIGSLLAADYGMLDSLHNDELIKTATNVLLDKKVGVYTAFPMDFIKYEKILGFGDEVGAPYYYFNGGVWPQDNAWYAVALARNGNKDQALDFIKKTMTLNGIMNGPNGQPAMYEVRNADKNNPAIYGTVDKPQFMWFGGWYLYSLYNIYLTNENDWNICLNPYLPEGQTSSAFTLNANGLPLLVKVTGHGKYISSIMYDNKPFQSAVIPENLQHVKNVSVDLGIPKTPYLASTNSSLINCSYDAEKKIMSLNLEAFAGHENESIIISPISLKELKINRKKTESSARITKENNFYKITIISKQDRNNETIELSF